MTLRGFQSICPICGKPIAAVYAEEAGKVFVEKTCEEHGAFRALASEVAADFWKWNEFRAVTAAPRVAMTKGVRGVLETGDESVLNTGCPYHCGVCDNHLMSACCVLLNVTERCNQKCPYCFAGAGETNGEVGEASAKGEKGEASPEKASGKEGEASAKEEKGEASLEKIGIWLDKLSAIGEERKFNIQLSGGEPTVRDDLPEIVRLCKDKGFEYVQLNTNGRRLASDAAYAKVLKEAGVSAVFLQFDGVDDSVYMAMRGEPLFEEKKRAIENCGAAGLSVTLVPTIVKSVNLSQVGAIINFMLENLRIVKGVHFQPASFFGREPEEMGADGDFVERVTMFAVMEEIEKQTDGRMPKAMLKPISAGHPLCCFCAAFVVETDGSVAALQNDEALDCRVADAPRNDNTACCCADPLEIIRRDRDFVLNRWKRIESKDNSGGFDEAAQYLRDNSFTVSGMAFMDRTNLDAERLRRCRVQVWTEDERLVSFCGYYTLKDSGFICR